MSESVDGGVDDQASRPGGPAGHGDGRGEAAETTETTSGTGDGADDGAGDDELTSWYNPAAERALARLQSMSVSDEEVAPDPAGAAPIAPSDPASNPSAAAARAGAAAGVEGHEAAIAAAKVAELAAAKAASAEAPAAGNASSSATSDAVVSSPVPAAAAAPAARPAKPTTTISTTPPSSKPILGSAVAADPAPPRPGSEPPRPWWKAKPRPKYPNDWRKVVGGIGWSFITAGVLILLFVVYQLYGTGIQYASAQDDLAKQFAAKQAEIAAAISAAPATTVAPTSPPTVAPTAASAAASTASTAGATAAGSSTPATDAATTAAPATTSAPVAPYPGTPIELGDAIGKLTIPKIGVDAYVLAGVRTQDIAKGIGHFPDTPLPGQQGNAALAGHRTTHGGVFGDLDELVPGDEIDFTTLTGVTYTYLVTGSTIVAPNQVEVLADHPDKVMLTLATCTPKFTAKSRLIVTAELKVGDQPVVQPATKEYGNPHLNDNGKNVSDTSGSLGPDEGDTTAPGATTASGSVVTTPAVARPANASFDALNEGWFSDSGAYVPVVLWGLALIAVAIGAWMLSRKTRRLIGWAVAFAPFIVLLYFWFENVNRMLPPNL